MGNAGSIGAGLEAVLKAVEPGEPGFGAGVAAARNGVIIGSAWIGEAAPGREWLEDTPIVTWSVSKGVAAMVVARLMQDGQIDADAPIRTYWPAFQRKTGSNMTLADVMTHCAGLPWIPEEAGLPTFSDSNSWGDCERIEAALAYQPLIDGVAGRVAYHALTYGWLVGACVRRATGLGLDAHLQRLFARPHNLGMGFGTKNRDVRARLAHAGVPMIGQEQAEAVNDAFRQTDNHLRRGLSVPVGMTFQDVLGVTGAEDFLEAETPAISLVSDAGSLARAYSLFAGGERVGSGSIISNAGRDAAISHRVGTDDDGVTGGARNMALGFVLNSPPSISLAPGSNAFGHPGMGGSLAWGDPDTGLGFAYLTNAAIPDTETDPRAVELSELAWSLAAAI